jgi:hypothetical protein
MLSGRDTNDPNPSAWIAGIFWASFAAASAGVISESIETSPSTLAE